MMNDSRREQLKRDFDVALTGSCGGEYGPCFYNSETGYMEYCEEHEGRVADVIYAFEAKRKDSQDANSR